MKSIMMKQCKSRTHIQRMNRSRASLLGDDSGNISILFAFALIPMMIAVGAGVDYSRAANLQTKLQSLADAAALSTVTNSMMTAAALSYSHGATVASVEATAENVGVVTYNAQTSNIGVTGATVTTMASYQATGGVGSALVQVTDTNTTTTAVRNTVVTFKGVSNNIFGGFLGMPTVPVSGTGKSTSGISPNINFYMLLDTSPSMALPTTTAGLTQMVNATKNTLTNTTVPSATGCAFSCHQAESSLALGYTTDNMITYPTSTSSTSNWAYFNTNSSTKNCWSKSGSTWTYTSGCSNPQYNGWNQATSSNPSNYVTTDYYNYAVYSGIPLRIQNEITAVQNLTVLAPQYATSNGTTYQMQISTFDANYSYNSTLGMSSNWSTISTAVGNINMYEAYANNLNSSGSSNNDQDTGFVNAFTNLLGSGAGALPATAGTGVGTGSTPQDILFIITDGMRDESISGTRTMGGIDTSYCTTVKNRGIKIAILYTQYLPAAASDSWSISNVLPFLSPTDTVATALSNCATPGLMYTVTTDQNITDALATLFQQAIEKARLSG